MKNGKERRNKEEEFEKITIYSQISTARGKIRLLQLISFLISYCFSWIDFRDSYLTLERRVRVLKNNYSIGLELALDVSIFF